MSLYCISLTDDWHKEESYPCWDAFCGIDGPLSESLVEQWVCDYESQSGGLEYGDGRFEHYGWNSQDISVLDILIERLDEFTATMLKTPACTFMDPRYYGGLRGKVGDVTFDIDWLYRNPKGLKDLVLSNEEYKTFFVENVHVFADYFKRFSAQLKDMRRDYPGALYFVLIGP